jgi:hypothetical protein
MAAGFVGFVLPEERQTGGVEVGTYLSPFRPTALTPRGISHFQTCVNAYIPGEANMRISLNDAAKERLLTFMSVRGITNVTHGLNVLITEAALANLIPTGVDTNGNSRANKQAD